MDDGCVFDVLTCFFKGTALKMYLFISILSTYFTMIYSFPCSLPLYEVHRPSIINNTQDSPRPTNQSDCLEKNSSYMNP